MVEESGNGNIVKKNKIPLSHDRMIHDTFYTIVFVFYAWILFLEFITFLLGDSFLVLFMYGVITIYETLLYYMRFTIPFPREKKKDKERALLYTNIIILLAVADLVFHLLCWLFLHPFTESIGERAVLPIMILADAVRFYYEFLPITPNTTEPSDFSFTVSIGT